MQFIPNSKRSWSPGSYSTLKKFYQTGCRYVLVKFTEYQELWNGSYELIITFVAGGFKRHSPNACSATAWITASVRRDNRTETNELNINFVFSKKYYLENQV